MNTWFKKHLEVITFLNKHTTSLTILYSPRSQNLCCHFYYDFYHDIFFSVWWTGRKQFHEYAAGEVVYSENREVSRDFRFWNTLGEKCLKLSPRENSLQTKISSFDLDKRNVPFSRETHLCTLRGEMCKQWKIFIRRVYTNSILYTCANTYIKYFSKKIYVFMKAQLFVPLKWKDLGLDEYMRRKFICGV